RSTPADLLGNTGTTTSSSFIFDSSGPLTVVTRPQEGVGYNGGTNALTTLSATVTDLPVSPLVNVGVDSTKIFFSLRRDDNNDNVPNAGDKYWDGNLPGAFNGVAETVRTMTLSGGSLYTTAAPTWVSGYRYFMDIWAQDTLGNTSPRITRRFTIDSVPPASLVT